MGTPQLMELGHDDAQEEKSLKELEALKKISPFASFATSYGMGWKGLQVVRMESPVSALSAAGQPRTHVRTPGTHVLVLTIRPPDKLDLRYEGVKRDRPLPAGSINVVPAGSSVLWHCQESVDMLIIYLERAWSRESRPSRSDSIQPGRRCYRAEILNGAWTFPEAQPVN